MSIVVNGKVIRSLPEQLSELTKEYSYLKKVLEDKEWSISDINIVDGDLVFTLFDGSTINAGPILNGDLSVSGDLTVANDIDSSGSITGEEILEKMTGYSFDKGADTANNTFNFIYAGVVKNGNKLTLALAFEVEKLNNHVSGIAGDFVLPLSLMSKLYSITLGGNSYLSYSQVTGVSKTVRSLINIQYSIYKHDGNKLRIIFDNSNIIVNDTAYIRIEQTYLLSDNLAE